ncbi:MAG: ATP-binding cassette domain-containing protein [Pseudomonadota bacterium]
MLDLKDVSKKYGRTIILNDITSRFEPGVTVITGPSGVGKSTLLRLCATVEKQSSGVIEWQGSPLRKSPAFRRALGYAPQRIDFPEDLSAIDFMLHVAALKRLPLGSAKAQCLSILDRLGLSRDANKPIATWSGGMRRRLGVAQAFLGSPEVLIFDEPTAELDSDSAQHVNALIFEAAEHAVVLMTTHLESHLSDYDYQTLRLEPPQ